MAASRLGPSVGTFPATFPLPRVTRRRSPLLDERRQAVRKGMKPCAVDYGQLLEVEQDTASSTRLGDFQCTIEAGHWSRSSSPLIRMT